MIKKILQRIGSLSLALLLILSVPVTAFAASVTKVRLNEPGIYKEGYRFEVSNMFPGDSVSREFTVVVSHKKAVTLHFETEITKKDADHPLSDVLMLRIEVPGQTVYEGLMKDVQHTYVLPAAQKEAVYTITAYLPTSVGNDYMRKSLMADFIWWYEEEPVASVTLEAEKQLDSKFARGNDFTFTLTDEWGNVLQTVHNHDGEVKFDPIEYLDPGTYVYYIKESKGSSSKLNYDTTTFKATVTVKQEADRSLTASVKYSGGKIASNGLPRFVNTTKGKPTDPGNPWNPKTGDTFRLGLFVALMVDSLVGIIFLLILWKRRKKEDETND